MTWSDGGEILVRTSTQGLPALDYGEDVRKLHVGMGGACAVCGGGGAASTGIWG